MWWSSGNLYGLELLSVDFLTVRKNNKIIAPRVLEKQWRNGNHEVDFGHTLGKSHLRNPSLSDDLVSLKVVNVHGYRILPDTVGQLKKGHEWPRRVRELREVPNVEDANDADLASHCFYDGLIA